jgi:hypothetical protein
VKLTTLQRLCALALLFTGALLLTAPSLPAFLGEVGATILCQPPLHSGATLAFSCDFINRGSETLYVLAADPILEGPGKEVADYFFLPPGGKRFENVLQYHKREVGNLDFPILFHSTIHLRLSDLSHLREVETKKSVRLTILWTPLGSDRPGRGDWIGRVKLLYLSQTSALQLVRQAKLPPVCKGAFSRSLQNARQNGKVSLTAIKPGKDRNFAYDGCRDIISERFEYLFSNTVTFKLTGE